MANLTEEQHQEMQQSDEVDYIGRQLVTINKRQEDLNKIAHEVDKKVVKIDDHIENAKNDMAEGNKELDKAEKDQKKCNIC